ncbi:MAG: hypothetical protein R2712_19860 [Vicinamibacterales bacterium]
MGFDQQRLRTPRMLVVIGDALVERGADAGSRLLDHAAHVLRLRHHDRHVPEVTGNRDGASSSSPVAVTLKSRTGRMAHWSTLSTERWLAGS